MAELHVQKKRNNYWWLWLIIILLIIAAAIYYYINYYHTPGNAATSAKVSLIDDNANLTCLSKKTVAYYC